MVPRKKRTNFSTEQKSNTRTKQKLKQTMPVMMIMGITILMSVLMYQKVIQREEEACWQLLQDSAQSVTKEMNVVFENDVSILRLAANMILNGEGSLEERFEELDLDFFREQTIFSRIDLFFPDETILLDGGEKDAFPEGLTFAELMQNGEHMSARMLDSRIGEETVYYMIPLTQSGETKAIISGAIPSSAIRDAFHLSIYSGKAVCCLVDSRDGNFVMDQWHTSLGNILEMEERPRAKGYENVDLKQANLNLETGIIAFRSQTTGKNLYMYYMPVNMFDWEIEVFVSEDAVFERMMYLRQQLLIAGVVEAVLLLFYFLWNLRTLHQMMAYQDELQFMSYWDRLTAMYNRNKYIQLLDKYDGQKLAAVGAAYLDLNGLKAVNDCQGHEAGDALICGAAESIRSIFHQNAYRIGGDEFVILSVGVEEHRFRKMIDQLEQVLSDRKISASLGAVWSESCEGLNDLLKEADARMYQKKEEYYSRTGNTDKLKKR